MATLKTSASMCSSVSTSREKTIITRDDIRSSRAGADLPRNGITRFHVARGSHSTRLQEWKQCNGAVGFSTLSLTSVLLFTLLLGISLNRYKNVWSYHLLKIHNRERNEQIHSQFIYYSNFSKDQLFDIASLSPIANDTLVRVPHYCVLTLSICHVQLALYFIPLNPFSYLLLIHKSNTQ